MQDVIIGLTMEEYEEMVKANTPAHIRTKAAIEQDIVEAERAKQALPELEKKIAAKERAAEDLERWNAQNRWPERQHEAMESAKSHIERAKTAEIALKRYIGQLAESPGWRAAQAMQTINSERLSARQAIAEYCMVDFEKVSRAAQESGVDTPVNKFAAAQGRVAEAASNTRILQMLDELDPGFSIVRQIPGEQHQIVAILKMLLWPQATLQRGTLDTSK